MVLSLLLDIYREARLARLSRSNKYKASVSPLCLVRLAENPTPNPQGYVVGS
jgi:hypothetical protein